MQNYIYKYTEMSNKQPQIDVTKPFFRNKYVYEKLLSIPCYIWYPLQTQVSAEQAALVFFDQSVPP